MNESPLITFWVTSTGREYVIRCVQDIVKYCTYPNYKILIYESQPDNPYNTVETFNALQCEKEILTNQFLKWPPLGWIYNLFMNNTDQWFMRCDDDTGPIDDPKEMFYDAFYIFDSQVVFNNTLSHVAIEANPRISLDYRKENPKDGSFRGVTHSETRPLLWFSYHPGLSLVDKNVIAPWDETVHWRDVEAVHMKDLARRGYYSVYMLKWWGCWVHFGTLGVDEVDRQRSTDRGEFYKANGYYGLRPPETWNARPEGAI